MDVSVNLYMHIETYGVTPMEILVKGGPEPLERESNKFLGSKRDDRFSDPFFEMVSKTCQGSFFVPALA